MKRIIFVLGSAPIFGLFSKVSLLTEINIERALRSLDSGHCDFVYIALDHFGDTEKQEADEYIEANFIMPLSSKLQCSVFVSTSSRQYEKSFIEYLNNFPSGEEVKVTVFSKLHHKDVVKWRIIDASDACLRCIFT